MGRCPATTSGFPGTLGDAALALAALAGRTTLAPEALAACRARLDRPQPRIALGIALRGLATAMLDVSDGLTGDLGHLLDAGGVGARIDLARIPASPALAQLRDGAGRALAQECLLAGGDDYELLFTARNVDRERVAAAGAAAGVAGDAHRQDHPRAGTRRARRDGSAAAVAAARVRPFRGRGAGTRAGAR